MAIIRITTPPPSYRRHDPNPPPSYRFVEEPLPTPLLHLAFPEAAQLVTLHRYDINVRQTTQVNDLEAATTSVFGSSDQPAILQDWREGVRKLVMKWQGAIVWALLVLLAIGLWAYARKRNLEE
ncbi:uncharacterized protein LTR77_000353 [Saxophila tyrrhenica]|uniref:Uncharacterized protein n=1 Tax=Saxophila tyrrhenica TaxID=1690608 RepID=A0AAV9PN40_9PEZI|nr:hypothetical protein LTR77_000353 [Saxophila tyrrhenica]